MPFTRSEDEVTRQEAAEVAQEFASCTNCDWRPEATDEECDRWPGHFRGCMVIAEGKPINGWTCDGKGNLRRECPEQGTTEI